MVIDFSARHYHAPDNVKDHAVKRVHKFTKFSQKILQCKVILDHEQNDHIAEINLSVPGQTLFAKAVSRNMIKSIDQVVSKTLQQLIKHRSTLQQHH
jgi:ribosomal subunit interface protein